MIDVRKLQMLTALDRLGTVASVAAELHLTAPGVSTQLSALERELGVKLTERQGRRLGLTPAGKLLAVHGRDVLDRISLAEFEVAALRSGTAGTYRVAAFPSAARTLVADVWRELHAAADGMSLQVSTPEPRLALDALVAGETDLAVVHAYSNLPREYPEGTEAEALMTEKIWLAIREDDPLATGQTAGRIAGQIAGPIDLGLLAGHPWITPEEQVTCFEMVERACAMSGFQPRIVARSMDFGTQLELVAAGAGVALVPDLTVSAVPAGVVLREPLQVVERYITAVRRSSLRGNPGLNRITSLLKVAGEGRRRVVAPIASS